MLKKSILILKNSFHGTNKQFSVLNIGINHYLINHGNQIVFLTLFPEMCQTVMDESIIGRAQKKGAVEICYHQIRDYANNKHNRVDDPPFGGGMGMLLRAEPLALCMDDVIKQLGKKPYFIYMSPLGSVLTQQKAIELSQKENIAILCGHYEGTNVH